VRTGRILAATAPERLPNGSRRLPDEPDPLIVGPAARVHEDDEDPGASFPRPDGSW